MQEIRQITVEAVPDAWLQQSHSFFKPDVYLARCDERAVVVKDYGRCPAAVRASIGRWLIARETRALRHLAELPTVPDYIGHIGQFAFATAFVDGQQPDKGYTPVSNAYYASIVDTVKRMHALGVVHNDIRHTNVLIARDGSLFLLDFGAAMVRAQGFNPLSRLYNRLIDRLAQTDLCHVIKMKHTLTCEPVTDEERWLVRENKRYRKLTRWWKTYINKPLIRRFRHQDPAG